MPPINTPIPFHLQISVGETIGTRARQEDAYLIHQPPAENRVLICLSDGLGGHCDGDVASEVSVQESMSALRADREEEGLPFKAVFRNAILQAHRALFRIPHHYSYGPHPASTLICCTAYRAGELRVAGIGDSLAWIVRSGEVHELLARQGSGHVVAHALGDDTGSPPGAAIANASWLMSAGDRLLLASDGLLSLSPSEIVDVLDAHPEDPAPALIAAVERKGEKHQDNTVAIVVTAQARP